LVVINADSIFTFRSNPLSRLYLRPALQSSNRYNVNRAASQQQVLVLPSPSMIKFLQVESRQVTRSSKIHSMEHLVGQRIPTLPCGAAYGKPWIVGRSGPL